MESIYLKNIELAIVLYIAKVGRIASFPLGIDDLNEKEIKENLFRLMKKGYVTVDGEEYRLDEKIEKIVALITGARAYGKYNNESFMYIHDDGVLLASISHYEKNAQRFSYFAWQDWYEEIDGAYGSRENPVTSSDEPVKTAYNKALSFAGELSKDIPLDVKLFKNPDNEDELEIIGIYVGIYHYMAIKNEEGIEMADFSPDVICRMISQFGK